MTATYSDSDNPTREIAVAALNAMVKIDAQRFNRWGQPAIPDLVDIEEAIDLRLQRIILTAQREAVKKYAANPCMAAVAVLEAFDLQKRLNALTDEITKRNAR